MDVGCDPLAVSSKLESSLSKRSMAANMALKPPPPWEVLQHVNELVGASGMKGEVDKGVRALAQSALARLDVVNREEFDAQAEILQRMRAKVVALEAELEVLTRELETLARDG